MSNQEEQGGRSMLLHIEKIRNSYKRVAENPEKERHLDIFGTLNCIIMKYSVIVFI
jgi:hypothetical protein